MTRIQKTVFILVALVALVIGLTVYKVLNAEQQLDTTELLDAGNSTMPASSSSVVSSCCSALSTL